MIITFLHTQESNQRRVAYRNLIVPHFTHTLFARLKLAKLGLRDFRQVAKDLNEFAQLVKIKFLTAILRVAKDHQKMQQ